MGLQKNQSGNLVSSRGAIDASERIKSWNISIQVFSYCHCVLSTSETPDFVRRRVMLTAWSTSQFRLRLVELDIDRSDITIRQNGKGIRKDGDTACRPTSPSPGFEEACSQNICWCICLRTLFVCDPRYLREYRMLSCMHSMLKWWDCSKVQCRNVGIEHEPTIYRIHNETSCPIVS